MATKDLSREIRHRVSLTLIFGAIGLVGGGWLGATYETRGDAEIVSTAFGQSYLPARALIRSHLADIQLQRAARGEPVASPSLRWLLNMQRFAANGNAQAAWLLTEFDAREQVVMHWVWLFGLLGALAPHLIYTAVRRMRPRANSGDHTHRRGAMIVTAKELAREIQRRCPTDLNAGGVGIARGAEPFHILVAGSTGTGKSVFITTITDRLRERGDRAVFADSGNAAAARYYDPDRGDVILNPLDPPSCDWSPLAEMTNPWDADTLAESMIPTGMEGGDSAQWNHYAQGLLADVLQHVWKCSGSNADILRLATVADAQELRACLAGTASAALAAPGNEKMFGSVRAILGTFLSPLRYLCPTAGRDAWSMRAWVEQGRGWAYITYREDQIKLLRPLIATLVDIVSTTVLSQPPNSDARTWLVLDELPSLGKISSLEAFLTKARKAGGCAVLGIQAIAQLRATYGRDGAESLLACASSALILRVADADTADYLSRYLGEREIMRRTPSETRNDGGKSQSWTEQVQREPAVLASEIQGLPNLSGFFRHAGFARTARVTLTVPRRREVTTAFVARGGGNTPPSPPAPAPTPNAPPRPQRPTDYSDLLALFDTPKPTENTP